MALRNSTHLMVRYDLQRKDPGLYTATKERTSSVNDDCSGLDVTDIVPTAVISRLFPADKKTGCPTLTGCRH